MISFPNRARPNFSDILLSPSINPEKEAFGAGTTTEVKGTRWQPGIKIFENNIEGFDNELYKEWLSFMAEKYKERARIVIESQEFKARWKPLKESYREWKRKANLDTRIWIRSGQLLESIQVRFFPHTDSYGVGIDATKHFRKVITIKDGDGNIVDHRLGERGETSILFVARLMEFGTVNMPSRPLFRPLREKVQNNIRNYLDEFARLNGLEMDV